jgi:hypothetical protein
MYDLVSVYFIQSAHGPIKIGQTTDLVGRMKGLQSANSHPLKLVGLVNNVPPRTERKIHVMFAEHRLHGEWFTACKEILDYIDRFAKIERVCPQLTYPFGEANYRTEDERAAAYRSDVTPEIEDAALSSIAEKIVAEIAEEDTHYSRSYASRIKEAERVARRKVWKEMHERGIPLHQIARNAWKPVEYIEQSIYTLIQFDVGSLAEFQKNR